MTKKPKLVYSIKGKLVSALCMLLVAMIMVVSSTYAWFTLSTAPEVTGITTAVGANGALEMALLPSDGNLSSIVNGDTNISTQAWNIKNNYWGNLVDLSDNLSYGLDKITLYPSELNATNGSLQLSSLLKTPTYGADGRVSALLANTSTGIFNTSNKNFPINDDAFGVRAIGVSSGMTDRQLSYRNSSATANTAMSTAKNLASQSLAANGSTLANLALKKATDTTATYNQGDIEALNKIVNDLVKPNGILDQIEKAYMYYILTYAASENVQENDADDAKWLAVQAAVEGASSLWNIVNVENSTTVTLNISGANIALPDTLTAPLAALKETRDKVSSASEDLAALTGNAITWTELSTPLYKLANVDAIKVNGYEASTVKDNMGAIVSEVANKGLTVTMASGAGVYADIADHCGDYTSKINISKVEYNGLVLNNMPATMETESGRAVNNQYYLVLVSAAVREAGAPASGSNDSKPLSEFYGYVIDLAFRTNAAESNLLLQSEAVDRIYGDNTNPDTMGKGSTMTFTSTNVAEVDEADVQNLMKAIRIVFYNPIVADNASTAQILGYAKLEVVDDGAADGSVTAQIYMYEMATPVQDDMNTVYYAITNADSTTTYYTDATCTVEASGVTSVTPTGGSQVEVKRTGSDAVITALTQNVAVAVSALVYLDGAAITNANVAATAATSMSGTMNLQFASSATLVPMEYANLHTPGTNATTDSKTVTQGTQTYNGTATGYDNQTVTYSLDSVSQAAGWSVDNNGVVTIPTDAAVGSKATLTVTVDGEVKKITTITVVE